MRRARPQSLAAFLPVVFPAFMLTAFFVVPFAIMIAVSFFQRVQGAFYTPAFRSSWPGWWRPSASQSACPSPTS